MADAQIADIKAQLAAEQKVHADSATKVAALLKLSREHDLAEAQRAIKEHGFTAKDLELKQSRARAAAPRKSPAGRKTKAR